MSGENINDLAEEEEGLMEQKKEPEKAKEQQKDPIISILGSDLGIWQLYICLLIFLSKFPTGWVQLSMVFLTNKIDVKNCSTPEIDACSDECEKIEYDHSVFEENIQTEFNLVCGREYLASVAQSLVMIGIMFGNMIFGVLADKYGRRPTFVFACVMQLISGVLVSAAPWFWLFCLLRFLVAFATGGTMCTGFVIITEIVGKGKREMMSLLYQIPFNLGHATLPLFAYFLRHWRWYHLSFSSFSAVYLIFYFTVPESPRWLLITGNIDKAEKILEKGAKCQKMPTEKIRAELDDAYKIISAKAPLKKGTMLDLFKTPYLRLKTIAMAWNWLAICLVYYGVSQYITNLSGNIFQNVAVGACLGVPGTILCVPLTKYCGRKFTLIASNATATVPLLLMAILPIFLDITGTVEVVLASIGLFGASVTFPNVYLYSAEIFPTVVRPSGVGFCSFIGRFGSICAPFVSQLSKYGLWISPLIFGIISLIATLVTTLLPETRGSLLPETLEDGESFGKKTKEQK